MQDARATLRDELGLDPGQALQQLEKAILLQDPSLDLRRPVRAAPAAAAGARPRPARRHPSAQSAARANAYGADYCRACGAPLAADVSIETRKTVTVLFCDVVAYTELAGQLDPEALRHVMSRFFELAAGTIERHGGTVEKFIGDEVMAVFGVPVVREDDALRAVRAARRAARAGPGARDRARLRRTLEVRIGDQHRRGRRRRSLAGHGFVTGEPVAVGKRLEQSARRRARSCSASETHAPRRPRRRRDAARAAER